MFRAFDFGSIQFSCLVLPNSSQLLKYQYTSRLCKPNCVRPLGLEQKLLFKMRIQDAQDSSEVPGSLAGKGSRDREIRDLIRARRGPESLLEIDRILLHSVPLAAGWHSFFGAVRNETLLPADIREVAICRVAAINHAWYEWKHHAPLARAAGVTEAGMDSILGGGFQGLSTPLQLVLRYTDTMTKQVAVDDPLFREIKAVFSDRYVVELTLTIAAYNCVSRFLVALNIGDANGQSPSASSDRPETQVQKL